MSMEFSPVHSLPRDELGGASLLDTPLRVWAEVGRTRMPAASVVGMVEGTIIDLDQEPDALTDLYVNGRHFGTGRLILVEGEWALRIESLTEDQREDEDEDAHEDQGDGADQAIEHVSNPVQGDPDPSD